MRCLSFALMLFCYVGAVQAQTPGMPGTATPQPYAVPEVRTLPAPRSGPPLLVNPQRPQLPSGYRAPAERDKPLPQLDSETRRRLEHPGEPMQRKD